MVFTQIVALIREHVGEAVVLQEDTSGPQPILTVPPERIAQISGLLHEHDQTYFDFLSCLTGIDNGPAKGTLEVLYHLYSIPYEHAIVLRVVLPRNQAGEPLPQVPTVSHIWRTANWHEREAYDLVGIHFTGHPDLRRILCAADWQGHPLRKDYQLQGTYHGIEVAY